VETIVTKKKPTKFTKKGSSHNHHHQIEPFMVEYKTRCMETDLLIPWFHSLLCSISSGLYKGISHSTCEVVQRTRGSDNLFLLQVSVEVRRAVDTDQELDELVQRGLRKHMSTNPKDLALSVNLFSRAFPWHFVLNRDLHIVQLGTSLLKLLFPTTANRMQTSGNKVTQFFHFVRPDLGFEISYDSISQRLNTPFLLRLKHLPTLNTGAAPSAEVILIFNYSILTLWLKTGDLTPQSILKLQKAPFQCAKPIIFHWWW